jgi:GT2 family glycosyltransferase
MLMPSLRRIHREGDALLIDNTTHQYASCAAAYNTELAKHPGRPEDILVFLHQDIAFEDDGFLRRITAEFTQNPNQVLGFAGMPLSGRTVSNLKYYGNKKYITQTQVAEKQQVESLDECCFAMTRGLYERVRFDEATCFHWHLYAVDFCYAARLNQDAPSFVLPEVIYHKMDNSSGLTTDSYFLRTLARMRRKYQGRIEKIYTPCFIVSTRLLPFMVKMVKSTLKRWYGR